MSLSQSRSHKGSHFSLSEVLTWSEVLSTLSARSYTHSGLPAVPRTRKGPLLLQGIVPHLQRLHYFILLCSPHNITYQFLMYKIRYVCMYLFIIASTVHCLSLCLEQILRGLFVFCVTLSYIKFAK